MDFSILNSLRIGHSAGKDFSDVQFYGTSIGKLVFLSIGPFTASLPVSICSVDHPELASFTKQRFFPALTTAIVTQISPNFFRRIWLLIIQFSAILSAVLRLYQNSWFQDGKMCAIFWAHSFPNQISTVYNDVKLFFLVLQISHCLQCVHKLCVWGFFSGQLFLFPLKNQPVVPGGICDGQLQSYDVHVSFDCTQRHFTATFPWDSGRNRSAPLSSGIPLFPGRPGRRVQRADHVCAADQTVPPQKVLP